MNLAQAKAVLEARAKERDAAEQADYEAKVREREEKARTSGRKPGGRPPTPPTPGPHDTDQYNFTDADSRIMKNGSNAGFDQHYNVQAVVDQASLLIVATALSNHPNDKREAEPALAALPDELGTPAAAALDNGYWGPATLQALDARGIEAYIATGREPHHTQLACLFRASACATARRRQSESQNGLQTEDRDWAGHLSDSQMHGRTGFGRNGVLYF